MWKLKKIVMEVPVPILNAVIIMVFTLLFFQVLGKANIMVELMN